MPVYTTWDEGVHRGKSIREDLQDWIANVAPADTPLLSGLDQTEAMNGMPEWLESSLPARANAGVQEGIAFTESALTAPTRLFNFVQGFYKGGIVSDKQRQVAHAGEDPFIMHQNETALWIKGCIECALHTGTADTGATATAPRMSGLIECLAASVKDTTSGLTCSEKAFNLQLGNTWTIANVTMEEVYCNKFIKRTISGYTQNRTIFLDGEDRRMVSAIDQYSSDFGNMRIYLSRDQLLGSSDGAPGNSWVAIDPTYFETRWLEKLNVEEMPRSGWRDSFQVKAAVTLVFKSPKAGSAMTNCRGLLP